MFLSLSQSRDWLFFVYICNDKRITPSRGVLSNREICFKSASDSCGFFYFKTLTPL